MRCVVTGAVVIAACCMVLTVTRVAEADQGQTFEPGGGRTEREILTQGFAALDYRVPRRLVRSRDTEPLGWLDAQRTPFVIRTLRAGETPLAGHQVEERVVKTLVVPRSTNPYGNELKITVDTFAGARIVRFEGHNAPPARRLTPEDNGIAAFTFAGTSYRLDAVNDRIQVPARGATWRDVPLARESTLRESVQVPLGVSGLRSAMAYLDDAPEVAARHEQQTTPPLSRATREAMRDTARLKALRRGLGEALRQKDPAVREGRVRAWRQSWSDRGMSPDVIDQNLREMTTPAYPTGPAAAARNLWRMMDNAGVGRGMSRDARELAIWRAATRYAQANPVWGSAIEALNRYPVASRVARTSGR